MTIRLSPAPSVFSREFDGELVLLDLARGEYFGLDEIGALLWAAVVDGRDVSTVAEQVTREFAVDAATAAADLEALVDVLVERGLLLRDGA